jgi:hypothetical protein
MKFKSIPYWLRLVLVAPVLLLILVVTALLWVVGIVVGAVAGAWAVGAATARDAWAVVPAVLSVNSNRWLSR